MELRYRKCLKRIEKIVNEHYEAQTEELLDFELIEEFCKLNNAAYVYRMLTDKLRDLKHIGTKFPCFIVLKAISRLI